MYKMNNNRGRSSSSTTRKCKKHPKQEPSPGICSLCLRERLLKISRSSSRVVTYVSSSSSCSSSVSSISSVSSSSGTGSPAMHAGYHEKAGHLSFLKSKLKKSKSMAFVSERSLEDDAKKKGGFWSKLMHSRTMREMLTTRV